MIQDLQRGIIGLSKRPISTLFSISILAIVLGVNIAIFSIVNVVLLRGLPFDRADRLVMIYHTNPSVVKYPISYPDYVDWKEKTSTFEGIGAFSLRDEGKLTLLNRGDPIEVQAAYVSDDLFNTMGISLTIGRTFSPEDQVHSDGLVVILSHHIWQREYGSSEDIIGNYVEINEDLFSVIGIATSHQAFPSKADIWLPLSRMGQQHLVGRERKRLWIVGRLKPGVMEHQAETEIRSVMTVLTEEYPRMTDDRNVEVTSLLDHIAGDV